jgi:hypothetical protein
MTTFQTRENVMKNQEQANNNNYLKDPTIAIDPQAQVEFDDLPISSEQEEQVKGGMESISINFQKLVMKYDDKTR